MTVDEIFQQGLSALEQAEFEQAAAIFGELVTADETHAEAWHQLAVCYLESRRPDLAVEALERDLTLRPESAATHYLLGTALGTMGRLDEAAASYRRALALDPAHQKAEEFLIRTESLRASREHFRRALRLLNSQPEGGAERRRVLDEALREMLHSINLFPGSPAREQLGPVITRIVGGIIAEGNQHTVPLAVTGELRLWAERYERACGCILRRDWLPALQALREALLFRDQDAFVHHAYGLTLFHLNELDGAIEELTQTLDLEAGYDLTSLGRLALP